MTDRYDYYFGFLELLEKFVTVNVEIVSDARKAKHEVGQCLSKYRELVDYMRREVREMRREKKNESPRTEIHIKAFKDLFSKVKPKLQNYDYDDSWMRYRNSNFIINHIKDGEVVKVVSLHLTTIYGWTMKVNHRYRFMIALFSIFDYLLEGGSKSLHSTILDIINRYEDKRDQYIDEIDSVAGDADSDEDDLDIGDIKGKNMVGKIAKQLGLNKLMKQIEEDSSDDDEEEQDEEAEIEENETHQTTETEIEAEEETPVKKKTASVAKKPKKVKEEEEETEKVKPPKADKKKAGDKKNQ